jgi:hypothetical protein
MLIQIEIDGLWQEVTKQQVFEMAAYGDIQSETIIDVDGQKIPASKIPGIVFADDEHPDIVSLESDSDVTFPMIYEDPKEKIKLEIYENKIVIKRKGIMNTIAQGIGSKTIHYSKISAIYHGVVSLRFTLSDADSQCHTNVSDENTIWGVNYEVMSCIQKFIEAKIANVDSKNAAIALQLAIERKKERDTSRG